MGLDPGAEVSAHPLDRQVRLVLQAAMLIFVWTIGIGILNGLDLVEFTRAQLLSHLHGGTLGWMTLGIMGATLWLFGVGRPLSAGSTQAARWLSILAPAAIAAYVFAFATTTAVTRPVAGVLTLAALVGFWLWALSRSRGTTLAVPHLFVLVGLTSSVLGGLFGVINGFAIALGWTWVPASFFGAHPGTMEVGFVMPVAMGLAEWGLRRDQMHLPAPRWGKIQVALMFGAFVVVLAATLAEVNELIGLATLVAVIAVVVFFVRMWRPALRVSLLRRGPERHAVMGGLLLGATIVYITVAINMAGGDFAAMPRGQGISFIHLLSVGGTTNALLALVLYLSMRSRPTNVLDDVVFWGLNVGLVGFVVALTADIRVLIPVFTPLMGLSLLLAIGLHVTALRGAPPAAVAPELAT